MEIMSSEPPSNPVEQIEIFVRALQGPGEYRRIGLIQLSSDGSISLLGANDQALRDIMEHGVSPRDPHLKNVLPAEGKHFLDTVADHYKSASYYKVRRTTFVDVPDGHPLDDLRNCLVSASAAVGSARDVSSMAMEVDMSLARAVETLTEQLELLRDKLHDALLTDEDRANGATPRLES